MTTDLATDGATAAGEAPRASASGVPGPLGAWVRGVAAPATPELAAELEGLGYSTLWLGAADGDLRLVDELLDATTTLQIATGIVNIWRFDADSVAAAYHRVRDRHGERFLLGIGVGHPEATGERYTHPYRALVEYLDALDLRGVPVIGRVLAALGPRVLRLSAERSAGAHPYLVTPEHTHRAREILGAGPLLIPDHKVVLHNDPAAARGTARSALARYLGMVNYRNSLASFGFGDEDVAGGGSDRLVDAVYAWGEPVSIVTRLREHLSAGADQVAVNPVTGPNDDPLRVFRAVADAWDGPLTAG